MPDNSPLQIGVDVGGTFTDLVSFDGQKLRVLKLPSTPPLFEQAVIDAVRRAAGEQPFALVHGSTVATNALLQRAGAPIAFITTDGFKDMLLIGRQNRPNLYSLHPQRSAPIADENNCFTLPERLDAHGNVLLPLDDADILKLIARLRELKLEHVAVCLLFSFINPSHEQRAARILEREGFTVSLSSDILPEFREYERACTTAINASLRPTVEQYLRRLESGLSALTQTPAPPVSILHSTGGTFPPAQAAQHAARLLLSGPAGGLIASAFVAQQAGYSNLITYDMGGTSTDVALIRDGQPQWTMGTTIDGLPVSLPMFDIHTIGAGGGSIAELDAGGALRVGPKSSGAAPGPACYGRGGTVPTVTDANLLLGRIPADRFLGGEMPLDADAARRAIEPLALAMKKRLEETALGILRVAEANMAGAIRAVTTRRGHDPRDFALFSFGGAGGLHACALADALDIPTVLVPPYAGVLSALGMVVAPPVADASRTVLHLQDQLDDDRLAAEFGYVSAQTLQQIDAGSTARTEVYVDARFRGQSHELQVRIHRPSIDHIREAFLAEYTRQFDHAPAHREIEIVTLRVRRFGHAPAFSLPDLTPAATAAPEGHVELFTGESLNVRAPLYQRATLLAAGTISGPALILDPESTTYLPAHWQATATPSGLLVLSRRM